MKLTDGLVLQLLNDPNALARDAEAWINAHSWMLGSASVALVATCAAAGTVAKKVREKAAKRKEDAKRYGGIKVARRAGLLRNETFEFSGIPIGIMDGKNLCWTDQEILLVTGGTRSGKGVGVIRPAAVTYGGPGIFYDGGKGELHRDTAGHRSGFSHVINFDLTNPEGAHFNFLEEIDPKNPVSGCDNLAKAVPREDGGDSHFEASAERLMGAVFLHVLHALPYGRKNIGEAVAILARGDEGMKEIVQAAAHPIAVQRIQSLFNGNIHGPTASDGAKGRQILYTSALVRLAAFEDPVVAEVTSRSDFRIRDIYFLSDKGRPASLYLTTPPDQDDRLRPVFSMLIGMIMNGILRDKPADHGQPRTLLVLDEFASLRMKIVETAATKIVGCGCTMLLGAQSLNALSQKPYGPMNQFRDNIRCHVAFAANDENTQRAISKSAGTYEDTRKSVSGGGWFSNRSKSETESETVRPVITEGEVRELEDEDELIFVTGRRVMKANKIRDYQHPILKQRLGLQVPPMRNPDGSYYNAPNASVPSPWANILVLPPKPEIDGADFTTGPLDEEPPEQPSPAAVPPTVVKFDNPAKPKRAKRKLIAATED